MKKVKEQSMTSIQLSNIQREQMAGLIGQYNTARTIAEAFVGYFAKELGVNLQLYQFDANTLSFEPVQGYAPPPVPEPDYAENGKVTEAI
jgi:hypothetical protein